MITTLAENKTLCEKGVERLAAELEEEVKECESQSLICP